VRPRVRPAVALVAAGALLLSACGTPAGVAATVNGERIATADLEVLVEGQVASPQSGVATLTGAERLGRIDEIQRQTLSTLIQLEVFEQVAADRGIEIDDQAVQDRFELEATAASEDPEATNEENLASFEEQIEEFGLTVEHVRRLFRAGLIQEALQQSVADEVEVTDADVRAAFEAEGGEAEEADVSHILVPTAEEAEEILAELAAGGDFAALAEERSQDPGSAALGGNLGFAPRGAYVPEFDAAVWEATPGEVVGPVETQFGFHLIRVEEFRTTSFEEEREALEAQVRDTLAGQAFEALLQAAFGTAEVEVDSRFGEWDPTTGSVVPDGGIGPIGGTGDDSPVLELAPDDQ
jgi:parvulin-like peptidyl-prolyl isomerase